MGKNVGNKVERGSRWGRNGGIGEEGHGMRQGGRRKIRLEKVR